MPTAIRSNSPARTTPYGTVDRTWTDTLTVGGSLQATSDAKVFGHDNYFVVGGSIDHSQIDFSANSTLGYIYPDLSVANNAAIPGTGSVIHTLGNIGYGPVGLDAQNTYYGLYATDTFDITSRLSATLGARLNVAKINMADQLGTSPDLNGDYTFQRLNPVTGLAYKVLPGLTAYAGYSESNRAPTPLELGCANPNQAVPAGGLPGVRPAAAAGRRPRPTRRGCAATARSATARSSGSSACSAPTARTTSSTSRARSRAAACSRTSTATRRQGLEAGAEYRNAQWLLYANYSYIDATYQFTGLLASPNNPLADVNGNVQVTPGDHIPGIPQHQFKAGADYIVTPEWKVGADFVAVGSQYFVGDDANQNDKLPAYWYVNLHTSYQISKEVQVFALVNNLFNKQVRHLRHILRSASVLNAIPTMLTDHRTITPAQPLAFYAGMRIKL